MSQGNSKLFAITTALFVVLAIIFFTLSITSIGQFTAQKKRVHHMEQQLLAGKSEILKVPEMIGKLRVADKSNKQLEGQVAELTEASKERKSELNELKKELTTVTIAKLVLETDRAGYTKNLVEARQAVRELREHGSTDYSIDEIEEIPAEPSHEATHEPEASSENIPLKNVWE